jgi:flagellar motor switch protein FliM
LSLAPGDVIRLDKQADAPLTLASMSSRPLFHAYLGRCRDEVAVELVQSHTPVGEVQ